MKRLKYIRSEIMAATLKLVLLKDKIPQEDYLSLVKNLDTSYLMIDEYIKSDNNGWLPYPENKPQERKQYEVYRKGCDKQHYCTYNGTAFAYDDKEITDFREKQKPKNA